MLTELVGLFTALQVGHCTVTVGSRRRRSLGNAAYGGKSSAGYACSNHLPYRRLWPDWMGALGFAASRTSMRLQD